MVTAAQINSRISMMRENQKRRREEIARNIEFIKQQPIQEQLKIRRIRKELSRFKGAAVEKQIQQLEAKLRKAQFQAARRQRKDKTPEEAERLRRESAKRAVKRRREKQRELIEKVEKQKAEKLTKQKVTRKRIKLGTIKKEPKRKIVQADALKEFQKATKQKTQITPFQAKQLNTKLKEADPETAKKIFKTVKDTPKNVVLGAFEFGKELGELAGAALIGSVNYGKSLKIRYDKGEKTPLRNDIQKLAKNTAKVGKFVKDNPQRSAEIVGLAVAAGYRNLDNAFNENPVKATTKGVLFLFPGTIINRGVKGAKAVSQGIKSSQQAARFATISNKVKPVTKAGLTQIQKTRLSDDLIKASKVSNAVKRDTAVKTALKKILKDRGLKAKRGASLDDIVRQVKASKAQPIKIISKGKAPKKPKVSKKVSDKPKVKRKREKVVIIEDKKAKVVTKTQFKKLEAAKRKARKQKVKKAAEVAVKKSERIKKAKEAAFKKELSQKGVIKKEGEIFIDINAVQRLEKANVAVKPVQATKFGKKAQARFQIQIQKQINKSNTKVKKLSRQKKPNKNVLRKERTKLRKLSALIKKLDVANLIRGAFLIAQINKIIANTQVIESGTGKLQDVGQLPAKTPAKAPGKTPGKAQPQAKTPAKAQPQKKGSAQRKATPSPQKPVTPSPRKPKITKVPKKPVKALRIPIPKLKTLRKSGTRQGYIIKIKKGNIIVGTTTQPLPLKRATNLARRQTDNRIAASYELVKVGTTSIQDVKKAVLEKKFRLKRSKNPKVRKYVEKRKYRLDSKLEKKSVKKR